MEDVGTMRSVANTRAIMDRMAEMNKTNRGTEQTATGIRYREDENPVWNLEECLKFDPYRYMPN